MKNGKLRRVDNTKNNNHHIFSSIPNLSSSHKVYSLETCLSLDYQGNSERNKWFRVLVLEKAQSWSLCGFLEDSSKFEYNVYRWNILFTAFQFLQLRASVGFPKPDASFHCTSKVPSLVAILVRRNKSANFWFQPKGMRELDLHGRAYFRNSALQRVYKSQLKQVKEVNKQCADHQYWKGHLLEIWNWNF